MQPLPASSSHRTNMQTYMHADSLMHMFMHRSGFQSTFSFIHVYVSISRSNLHLSLPCSVQLVTHSISRSGVSLLSSILTLPAEDGHGGQGSRRGMYSLGRQDLTQQGAGKSWVGVLPSSDLRFRGGKRRMWERLGASSGA